MSKYFGVIGNRDYIKYQGKKRPFWEFLDRQPDGWLTSLVYAREDLPTDQQIIFDCGAWSYRNEDIPKIGKDLITPSWLFGQYQVKAKSGDILIAADHMLIPGVDIEARRKFNRQSAEQFFDLVEGTYYYPMATVHGMDLLERIETAKRYVDIGYRFLALGGLAARASQKALILDMVWEIRKAIPDIWLHVLGLSSPDYAAAWHEFGIQSFDGSSHFKQAFTAGAFFTLETDGRLKKWQAVRPDEEITAPECDCLACSKLRDEEIDTRSYGSNENNMGRAAHNMNMLMQAQQIAINGVTVLVSCVGKKQAQTAPASNLYQSDWFIKARAYAEQVGNQWYILSAEYGLLDPEKKIEPYEKTLITMPVDERQAWAQRTFEQIKRNVPRGKVIILAGQKYREYLLPLMLDAGYSVDVPMEGLGIGQQLAWLMTETSRQLKLF